MIHQYKIGTSPENDIVIKDQSVSNFQAEINYEKGNWILHNLVSDPVIYVNGEKVDHPKPLSKYDKIKIGQQTIYWSNYLFEGERQELYLKDIFSYNGRVSRSNFRALSLLSFGMAISVYFLPGVIAALLNGKRRGSTERFEKILDAIAPFVYTIGFSILGIALLLLSIKRMRDSGNAIWKLFIPFYNLKMLFFDQSKK